MLRKLWILIDRGVKLDVRSCKQVGEQISQWSHRKAATFARNRFCTLRTFICEAQCRVVT